MTFFTHHPQNFSHCYHSHLLSVFQLIVCRVFFVNSPAENFRISLGCLPWMVSPGAVPPLSDATGSLFSRVSLAHDLDYAIMRRCQLMVMNTDKETTSVLFCCLHYSSVGPDTRKFLVCKDVCKVCHFLDEAYPDKQQKSSNRTARCYPHS